MISQQLKEAGARAITLPPYASASEETEVDLGAVLEAINVTVAELADAAETARDEAQKWATEDEDVPVSEGPDLYSAYHWATKAEEAAETAAAAAVVGVGETLQGYVDDAEIARDEAVIAKDLAEATDIGAHVAGQVRTHAQVDEALDELDTMSLQAANNVAITGGTISGITDLAVADGGTGASTAAAARTQLGAANRSLVNNSSISIATGNLASIGITGGTDWTKSFIYRVYSTTNVIHGYHPTGTCAYLSTVSGGNELSLGILNNSGSTRTFYYKVWEISG
jgi:hypothetical protein